MAILRIHIYIWIAVLATTGILCGKAVRAETASTSVSLSICGDAMIQNPPEFCDTGSNTGAYATSIALRNCTSDCQTYGQYCGDEILQPIQGEECDDGNNTSGDRCTDLCKVEEIETGCCPGRGPSGGGAGPFIPGSSTAPIPTKVAILGKAYPDASVHILKDGEAIGVVKADAKADFYFATTNVTPGIATFGFWAEDRQNIKSIAYTITFRVVPNAVTTVTGAYLPPTIGADKRNIKHGEVINFFGQSVPEVEVHTHVNSAHEQIEKTMSNAAGDWKLAFDSSPLEDNDFHTVKALFQTGTSTNVIKSTFSELVSFFVGEGTALNLCQRSDINRDGKVNFVDFSILIFYWSSANTASDINVDGKVNLADFSIMLTCWSA